MNAETGVTVTASVIGEISSMATTVATSTPDVGFWQGIINWVLNLF